MALIRDPNTGEMREQESLQERIDKLNLGEPLTPQGAMSAGASPDQAKMIGSSANQQRVAKEQTLQGAQRLQGPREQQTISETERQAEAERLRELGSLGSRVQDQVQQMIQQQTTAQETGTAQVNQEALQQLLGVDPNNPDAVAEGTVYADSLALLGAYHSMDATTAASTLTEAGYDVVTDPLTGEITSPPNAISEARQVKLAELMNLDPKFKDANTQSMLKLGADATAATATAAIADTITIGNLFEEGAAGIPGWDSLTELASFLGVEETALTEMNVAQFQDVVTRKQESEFNRANELRAAWANAPEGSVQRKIYERQLRDLTQVGVTGTERKVAQTVDQLDTADVVKIGDQELRVDELLNDDNLSERIRDWLAADAETRKEIFPPDQFEDFTDWLSANQEALAQLSGNLTDTEKVFDTLQEQWQGLNTTVVESHTDVAPNGLNPELLEMIMGESWDPSQAVSSLALQAAIEQFNQSNVGQLLQSTDEETRAALGGEWGVLNKLNLDPSQWAAVADLDAAALQDASATANLLLDPDTAALMGEDPGDKMFITNAEYATEIKGKAEVSDLLKNIEGGTLWIEDENFKDLDTTAQKAMAESENPADTFSDFEEYNLYQAEVDSIDNIDDALDVLFGDGVMKLESLQEEYDKVKQAASWGHPDAIKKLEWFKQWDADGTGTINKDDLTGILEALQAGELTGNDAALAAVSGDLDIPAAGKTMGDVSKTVIESEGDWTKIMAAMKGYTDLDEKRFEELLGVREAFTKADFEKWAGLVKNIPGDFPKTYDDYVKSKATEGAGWGEKYLKSNVWSQTIDEKRFMKIYDNDVGKPHDVSKAPFSEKDFNAVRDANKQAKILRDSTMNAINELKSKSPRTAADDIKLRNLEAEHAKYAKVAWRTHRTAKYYRSWQRAVENFVDENVEAIQAGALQVGEDGSIEVKDKSYADQFSEDGYIEIR